MIDKQVLTAAECVSGIFDGAVIMVGGFGPPGMPSHLLAALLEQGSRDLTIVNNNAAAGGRELADLFRAKRIARVVCSYPKGSPDDIDALIFDELYRAKEIELELVPQGTLAERIRAAGAGVSAFYTRTAVGTELAAGREVRSFDGQDHILEFALSADFALVKAHRADRWGNLVYRKTARNFGPIMATAARVTAVEVDEVVELGQLDPEVIVTPGIYVSRVFVADERLKA